MKRMWFRLFAMVGLLAGLGMPAWASAEVPATLGGTDVKAIQSVIRSQLKALANDDAARAFALATPASQSRIGSADDFMRLIKEEYDPIYRHRRALLSLPQIIDGDTIETVRVTDLENRVWLAIYKMERGADGAWKIDGCQLLETTSISV